MQLEIRNARNRNRTIVDERDIKDFGEFPYQEARCSRKSTHVRPMTVKTMKTKLRYIYEEIRRERCQGR